MTLLNIENLEKSYGKIRAVRGVDLKIEEGEICGLLGPNGAGKSTTIACISTLLRPDAGVLTYRETPVRENPGLIRSKIGVVPQEIALYPTLKGVDNLRFFGSVYGLSGKTLDGAIDRVAGIIGIGDRLNHRVDTYSGGMKRRLNIGAALLHDPELLIMDEPTVGIDPQSRRHILDTVLRLNREQGMTVLYTSHYMEEVEALCEKIHIMDEGRVIARGTHAELMRTFGGQEYLHLSFEGGTGNLEASLRTLSGVREVAKENGGYLLTTEAPAVTMGAVVDLARATGWQLKNLEHRKPTLETLFLQLTGKALRD